MKYTFSVGVDFLFIVTPIVGVCNCSMFCCTLLYSILKKKKTPADKFLDLIFRNNFFIFNFSKM